MIQSYARVSVEMPENEDKKSLHQELTMPRIMTDRWLMSVFET